MGYDLRGGRRCRHLGRGFFSPSARQVSAVIATAGLDGAATAQATAIAGEFARDARPNSALERPLSRMGSSVVEPECLIRPSASGAIQQDQPKAEMGDTQHVAGPEASPFDAPAVDPGSVGAAQVTNEKLAVCDGQAAVAAGYSR
jgi:hypothetical protein